MQLDEEPSMKPSAALMLQSENIVAIPVVVCMMKPAFGQELAPWLPSWSIDSV